MAHLIDTNVFITMERRGYAPTSSPGNDEASAISAITASELLFGAYRARSDEQRMRREGFVEGVLRNFDVLPFDLQSARIHAEIGAALAATGQAIGAHDLIIAATALANGYGVLTDKVREFARVPGLTVHQPIW